MRHFLVDLLVLSLSLVPTAVLALEEGTSSSGEAIMNDCLNGDGAACYNYAYFAMEKVNNMATYRLALKRGCALKHFKSCKQLEKDDSDGEEIRKKCESGDVPSCVLYSTGLSRIYEDRAGAIMYAIKACELGDLASFQKVEEEKAKKFGKKI